MVTALLFVNYVSAMLSIIQASVGGVKGGNPFLLIKIKILTVQL